MRTGADKSDACCRNIPLPSCSYTTKRILLYSPATKIFQNDSLCHYSLLQALEIVKHFSFKLIFPIALFGKINNTCWTNLSRSVIFINYHTAVKMAYQSH